MREQVADAHRATAAFLEEIRTLMRGAHREEVQEALARLAEVLDVHFEQEDRLYHSALTALRPDHRTTLSGFADAHQELRAHLAEIGRHLELGPPAETLKDFEAFVSAFRSHEKDEERLLRSLDGELAGE